MLIEVSKLSNLSASIASRVYPNNSLSGQLVQSGGTRDRGVNIVSVPTKSGRLATMQSHTPGSLYKKATCLDHNGPKIHGN